MKQALLDYIRQPIPKGIPIVPQSVPIPFFGDIETAKFATIAINPSNREFTDAKHNLLPKNKKRLIDRSVLGVKDDEELTEEHAQGVYESLRIYYHTNQYKQWFNPIENLFADTEISYNKGSLINLDISPWATSAKWGNMTDQQRAELVRHGGGLLHTILNTGQIQCLFVNGRTAIGHVGKHISRLSLHSVIELNRRCEIMVGKIRNLTIVGWSNYLQQERPPLSQEKRKLLADKILELAI